MAGNSETLDRRFPNFLKKIPPRCLDLFSNSPRSLQNDAQQHTGFCSREFVSRTPVWEPLHYTMKAFLSAHFWRSLVSLATFVLMITKGKWLTITIMTHRHIFRCRTLFSLAFVAIKSCTGYVGDQSFFGQLRLFQCFILVRSYFYFETVRWAWDSEASWTVPFMFFDEIPGHCHAPK